MILVVLLGTVFLLVCWLLEMFTDTWFGRFFRAQNDWLGYKNAIALSEPCLVIFGFDMVAILCAQNYIEAGNYLPKPVLLVLVVIMFAAALGLLVSFFDIKLPEKMYPEWHEKQRALKAGKQADEPVSYGQ